MQLAALTSTGAGEKRMCCATPNSFFEGIMLSTRRLLPLRSSAESARRCCAGRSGGRVLAEPGVADEEAQWGPRVAIKLLVAGWVGLKLGEYFLSKDALMVSSTVVLLKSEHAANRASGLYRMERWHRSSGAREAAVELGCIEHMLRGALATAAADPASSNVALGLLVELAGSVDAAPEQIVRLGGVTAAQQVCGAMPAGGEATSRCRELAEQLERALSGTPCVPTPSPLPPPEHRRAGPAYALPRFGEVGESTVGSGSGGGSSH